MTRNRSTTDRQEVASKATLMRLANSCTRLASRGNARTPILHDLDASDYQTIADILRSMAAMIPGDDQDV